MANVNLSNWKSVETRRWGYLGLGFLGMLLIGILYAWSILNAPLVEAFGWDVSKLGLTYTISISFFCMGSLLAAVVCKRFSSGMVILAAAVCLCGGFALTARSIGNIAMLYISYGVLVGSGSGMAYNVLVSNVCAWFPDRKGMASGVMMMGFGLSTMVIGKTLAELFECPQFNWRQIFTVFGIIIFLVLLLCSLVLRKPGAHDVLPAKKERAKVKKQQEAVAEREYTFSETIRQPSYWIFYVYGLLAAASGNTVIGFARNLALSVGATAAFAATLVGVLSVFNGAGRIFCGIIFDAWGRRRSMRFFSCLSVVATLIMLAAVLTTSLPLVVVGFCVTGICCAVSPTLSSVFVASMYGSKDFPLNYGVTNTKALFASLATTITGAIVAQTGSYVIPFILLVCTSSVALGLSELLNRKA